MLNFLKHLDVIVTFVCSALFAAFLVWHEPNRRLDIANEERVYINCATGECWHRSNGSLTIRNLDVDVNYLINLNDEVMTIGQDSRLLIHFRENKITIRDTTVIKVNKTELQRYLALNTKKNTVGQSPGEKKNQQDEIAQGKNNDPKMPKKIEAPSDREMRLEKPPQGLPRITIGNFSLLIVEPVPGTQMVAGNFPTDLGLVFQSDRVMPENLEKELMTWVIVNIDDPNNPKPVQKVKLRMNQVAQLMRYSGIIKIDFPGHYALIPDISPTPNNYEYEVLIHPSNKLDSTLLKMIREEKNVIEINAD